MIHLWIRNCRFLVDPVPREKIDSKMRKHAKDSFFLGENTGEAGGVFGGWRFDVVHRIF